MEITNIQILEHFVNEDRIYGKYFVNVNGQNKLVVRRTNEWCIIANYMDEPIRNCVMPITNKFRDAIIEKLGEGQ